MGKDIKEMALQNMIMKKVTCMIDCEYVKTVINTCNAIVYLRGAASPFLPVSGRANMKHESHAVSRKSCVQCL